MIEEFLPVFDYKGNQCVNARDLYEWLGCKSQFTDWVKYRINQYDLVENEDYFTVPQKYNLKNNGYSFKFRYILIIDSANKIFNSDKYKIKPRKSNITYIFWDKNNNAIKIGRTCNILKRQNAIRNANPFCELVAVKYSDIEKELHQAYKHLNIALEWFKADKNIIKEIIIKYNFEQLIKL